MRSNIEARWKEKLRSSLWNATKRCSLYRERRPAGVLACWRSGVLYRFGPALYSLPPASKLRASFRMCQKQRAKRLGCKVAAATDFFVWLPWQRDLFGLRLPGACLFLLRTLVLVLRVLPVPRLHLHLHLPPRSHLPQQRITDLPPHRHPTSTSTSTAPAPAIPIASAVAPRQLTVSSQLRSSSSYCSGHLTWLYAGKLHRWATQWTSSENSPGKRLQRNSGTHVSKGWGPEWPGWAWRETDSKRDKRKVTAATPPRSQPCSWPKQPLSSSTADNQIPAQLVRQIRCLLLFPLNGSRIKWHITA